MPDWSPPRRRGRSLLSRYKLSVNGTELNKTQQVLQKIERAIATVRASL